MSVRVRVIGPLTVERGEDELTGAALGGARERRLLAILALAGGQVVPKDAVIERLWDDPPGKPAAAVDTAVSLLRRALGPDVRVVETVRPGYRLTCATDVAEVDRLVADRRWEDAAALLEGELLGGDGGSEWLEQQRRELGRRRLDVLAHAARTAAARGDDPLALDRYSAVLDANPLREDAHRGVLACLARLGRPAEALRAYERCRRTLRDELGADPAPETTALYEQVLAGHPPEPDPTGAGPARTSAPSGTGPFLGRRAELARLATPADGCRVRAVLGEPGIGKSRLVEEVTAHLPSDQVGSTKCFRLVAPVPYAALGDLVPGLLAGDGPDAGTGRLGPEATATRLAATWANELAERPVTLVIDDLQWADEPSLAVLGLVLRRRPAGLVVLVTGRDTELLPAGAAAQLLELAGRLEILDTLTLGPLAAEEVVGGGYSLEDWEATAGHPLLLHERLHGGDHADLATLVLGRATAQGPDAVELLRAAAVLDRPAPLAELARLAGLATLPARDAAQRLTVAALLVESGGAWHVRHDVIAELVRAELAPPARRSWHARVLAHLAGVSPPADPAELAHHALAAEDGPACARHSTAAGEAALAAFANREATEHFDRVLGILAASDASAVEGADDLLRRAVLGGTRARIVLGRTDEARALLDRLPATEGRGEVERLLLQADCAWAAWKPSLAIGPAREALAVAAGLGDDALTGRVHAFIANPYGSLGELDLAVEHIDAALDISSRLGRPPPAVVLYRLALVQHQTGREHEALRTLDRCRELALAQHDERTLVFERIVRAWVLGALGRYGDALTALDGVGEIGRGEEAVVRSRVPNTRASLLFELGLVERALDADEESLEITRSHGGAAILEPQIHTLLNLAGDHLELGDPDRAQARLAEAEALSADAEYARFRYLNRLHWVRGMVQLAGDDVDGALGAADEVGAMASRYGAPKYTTRAHLLRAGALARRPREHAAALAEARAAVRLAERHELAALAQRAHHLAADLADSTHHARRARQWRARMVASVDGPLRAGLG